MSLTEDELQLTLRALALYANMIGSTGSTNGLGTEVDATWTVSHKLRTMLEMGMHSNTIQY